MAYLGQAKAFVHVGNLDWVKQHLQPSTGACKCCCFGGSLTGLVCSTCMQVSEQRVIYTSLGRRTHQKVRELKLGADSVLGR